MRLMPSTVNFWQSFEPVFPLTKILDANDWLSVQVHPDDLWTRVIPKESLNAGVIAADEGAEIIYTQCQEQGRAAPAD